MTDEKITRELTEIYDFIDSVVPNKRDATTIKLQFKYFENIESQLAEAEMIAQALLMIDCNEAGDSGWDGQLYEEALEIADKIRLAEFEKAQRAKSEVENG